MSRCCKVAVLSEPDFQIDALLMHLSQAEQSPAMEHFTELDACIEAILERANQFDACIIVVRASLPPSEALKRLLDCQLPTLVVAGEIKREAVMEALEAGVDELIERDTKGRYLEFLPHTLMRMIAHHRDIIARKEAETALASVAEGLSNLSGKAFFRQLTEQLSQALGVDIALIGELRGQGHKRVKTLAASDRGEPLPNFEYSTDERPSADVVQGKPCLIDSHLGEVFPNDSYIAEMELESYAGVPLRNEEGEIRGILAVLCRRPIEHPSVVISALRIFAARVEFEMERLRIQDTLKLQARMLDQIGQAIFSCDNEGRIKSWNRHAEELFGYAAKEAIGQPLQGIFSEPYAGNIESNLIEPLLIKGELAYEWILPRKDGTTFEAYIGLSQERSPEGEITGFIACCRDITERKTAERQKRAAQQGLRFHIQNSPLAFIEWDIEGNALSWNTSAERIFGFSAEEMVGCSFKSIFKEDYYDHVYALRDQLRYGKGGERSSNENVTKDGRVIHCEWYNTCILDESGKVIGFASLVDDVTERVENVRKLRQSEQEAARANRAKDEFLAVMSHEIRTPMNSIIGFADLLMENQADRSQRENVEIIKANAYHLLDLINNVLNFSRLDSGRTQLQQRDLDLRALAFEVEEAMRPEANQKGLLLRVELDPELPRYVRTGYLELRQILLSLVGNAIKFTTRGEVVLAMTAQLHEEAEEPPRWDLHLSVQDTGIGIAEEKIESIFNLFRQVDSSSTRKFGGTGLGLAICNKICALLGGRIWAESRLGKGSTFFVEIPCEMVPQSGHPTPPMQLPEEPESLAEFAQIFPARILIADDEEETLRLLGDMLAEMGYDYATACDGLECIETMQNQVFDFIFMDVGMPTIDGVEATQLIRDGQAGDEHRDVFICAITGYADGDDRQHCLDAGMNEHLGKPLLTKSLIKVLKNAAARRAQHVSD